LSSLEKITEDFYKTGIAICDEFITKNESQLLLAEIQKQQNSLQKAGIGRGENLQVNTEIRGDFIKWINEREENVFTKIYLAKLKTIMKALNKKFFLGLQKSEHHITFYPTATRYEKHVDTFKTSEARVVSTVLYLNKNWEMVHGGELCLYPENGPVLNIAPLERRLVLFESTLAHEVLENHAPRYSITGWLKRDALL